ncbi:hypothetical protein [Sinorhizobium psoraleae]|uniref:Transposase n=1 Tax=Sinorhizobium psoraleae TaxID=520838 RepID=A0ABT4KRY5_9HYPH|nr:hypothetical protein [Sinorhizobium psoraleae]MCZ4093672.1 hypothetical protein [Sinorhizobium psoraleae]
MSSIGIDEDPFFNEVALLDEKINELRRLLTQRLLLQNVQLKKMLERSIFREPVINWSWTREMLWDVIRRNGRNCACRR